MRTTSEARDRELEEVKECARINILNDPEIKHEWHLQEEGLWIFFQEYLAYFVRLDDLRKLIDDPPCRGETLRMVD